MNTFFKVCVAPTVKDAHETKCSLNFGSRAMKVQVTAHVNYEVDYKKLAEALAAKLETLGKQNSLFSPTISYSSIARILFVNAHFPNLIGLPSQSNCRKINHVINAFGVHTSFMNGLQKTTFTLF